MNKRLLLFFGFSYLFTWLFWSISVLDGQGVIDLPIDPALFGILGTFGPSLVGLILLIRWNDRRFGSILKETFWMRGSWSTKYLTLLLMPSILGGSYLITRFLFGVSYDLEWLRQPEGIPIVFLYILFLGGPLGEEIGWRGFALPELMKRYSPFVASIVLGVIWTCWHIPAFFIPGSAQQGVPFVLYLINTMVLTMILTVLYLRTRTIGNAVYFHTSSNAALGVFFIIEEPLALVFIAIGMIGTLVVLLYLERDRMFRCPTIPKDRP
jgi:membrane protease YdiL (CAAX protease family)